MKISEVTLGDLAKFCIADEDDRILPIILAASKAYVRSYTKLTDTELDEHEDITIALLVLCSDMYDNRQTTVDGSNENMIVSTILAMHSKNYL